MSTHHDYRPHRSQEQNHAPPPPPPKDAPSRPAEDQFDDDDGDDDRVDLQSIVSLPPLPPLPAPEVDASLDLDLDSILGPSNASFEKVQKRASNVLKLSEENDKLKAELRAMTERIEAAERRRADLERRAREAAGQNERAASSS
ncbi:hypothetical protein FA95DRAFT_1606667 [Auriscalpium vulgare]|uniref:Uncharacterized protein n=1 Tax=Auriscalpium vulgare TaxID=40419 RepID=A0ACB8RS71_9AGAM|nr:hypothetical protein FA95DRAFT_1606667 [Auriscalpium vulgare]